MRIALSVPVIVWLAIAGCAGQTPQPATPGPPDQPVPATEARAELRLVVDLAVASDCEEQFDLALYRNRGVDLIQWDDQIGVCRARSVTIRYLSRQVSRAQLLREVRELCARVVESPDR